MRTAGIGSLALVLTLTATAAGQPTGVQRANIDAKAAQDAIARKQASAFDPPATDGIQPTSAFNSSSLQDNAFRPSQGEYLNSGFYGRAEYLFWWLKEDFGNLSPLVTLGDPADTPTGALGQPGTRVLFGGDSDSLPSSDSHSGGRYTVGFWFGELALGLETTCFGLLQREHTPFTAVNTGAAKSGSLNLAFFNNDGGFEDAFNVGLEGVQAGRITIEQAQRLWGAEVNVPWLAVTKDGVQLTWLTGYRYVHLHESVDLRAESVAVPVKLGIQSNLFESHATRNNFHGGQIGARTDFFGKYLRVTLQTKLAVGAIERNVNIVGLTTNIDPVNGTVTAPGGLYTGPGNQGSHQQSGFAVAPELGINFGYCLTENISITAGYTFLYVSGVVRAGDQIDRVVNFQVDDRPRVLFHQSDFCAHGLNVGAVFRY